MKLSHTSIPIALASALSLGSQMLFGLLLLGLFTPLAVGEFSVISQVAFFWMTLALAQSPLKLLADVHEPPGKALRHAMQGSLMRLGLLMPLAALALHLSGTGIWNHALFWASLLATLQIVSNLAQTFNLRVSSAWFTAAGRAVPPAIALLAAGLVRALWQNAGADGLLLAAALGYACGTLWLLPALTHRDPDAGVQTLSALEQRDNRSTALRLTHATADAFTGAAILLIWQRSHGAAEAGYLAVLLRLLGFMPAVIHTAWAQVLLAQGPQRHVSPLGVGLAGAFVTALLGLMCMVAAQVGWLTPAWTGLLPYVGPVVLWQASACLLAACSHLPYRQGRSSRFSWAAIGFDLLQITVLCIPLAWSLTSSVATHLWWLSGLSSAGLLSLVVWLLRK